MNRTQKKSVVVATGIIGLAVVAAGMKGWTGGSVTVDSDTAKRLLQSSPHIKKPMLYHSEKERKALVARWRQLAALWLARDTRDVTSEIAAFLEDPVPIVRAKAAQMLGRLETAEAARILEVQWKKQQAAQKQQDAMTQLQNESSARDVPEFALRLALGRARGHKLKGTQKLEAISQSVGLSLAQVEEYATKIQDIKQAGQWRDSPIADVAYEIVDTLYHMKKRGEPIADLSPQRFSAGPALDVKLKGASLPLPEEVEAAVDYAARPKSGRYVESYLLELGSTATESLIQRLQQIEQSPHKDRDDWGYISMFRAAAMMQDPRVVPLLEKFRQSQNPSVSGYASQTLNDIQHDRVVPRVPA